MVDGKRVTTGTVTNDTLTYTQTSASTRLAAHPHLHDRPRALGGPDQGPLRVARRQGPRPRAGVRPAALQRRLRRRRLDARPRAALSHDQPDRLRAASPGRRSRARARATRAGPRTCSSTPTTRCAPATSSSRPTRASTAARARSMTLALGFATRGTPALDAATESLDDGFEAVASAYKAGWVEYRNQLKPIPAAALPVAAAYETSLLVLKAHEDKDNPGAFVASPSMPWGWGELTIDPDNPRSGPYHLVWPRDLYQVATALHAAGDTDCANDALDFAFDKQQLDDGSFPQNTQVDGRPKWTSTQMDQVGLPIVLAHQLGRTRPKRLAPRPRRRRLHRRQRPEERAGALGEPGGLLARDDRRPDRRPGLRRRHRAPQRGHEARRPPMSARRTPGSATSSAGRRRPTARTRPSRTTCGSPRTAGRTRARRYAIGDSGPSKMDQRRVVDVSFLELVRLGVKRPDDRGDRQHPAGRRRQARDGRVLAPLLVRRLRRAPQRQVVASVR